MADSKKTLTERTEEAGKKPLPYDDLVTPTKEFSLPEDEYVRSSSDANPRHREGFMSLLNAAARKQK